MPTHKLPEQVAEWETTAFDELVSQADDGQVRFRGRRLRIDHHKDLDGSEVRSVVEAIQTNAEGYTLYQTSNLITHPTGTYLEVHPCVSGPNGGFWEPEAGSPWIMPGTHADLVLHCQVADEAQLVRQSVQAQPLQPAA
jgi:hypothetical protein